MRRGQDCSISSNGHYKIDICQVLSVQLNSVDAREIDLVLSQDAQQIIDALFVRLKSGF
jgi:hypothetical protein